MLKLADLRDYNLRIEGGRLAYALVFAATRGDIVADGKRDLVSGW